MVPGASTGPLIEISGKRQAGPDGHHRDAVASTGPLIEISGKQSGPAWMAAWTTGFNGAADRDQRKAGWTVVIDETLYVRLQRGR